jgi:hypothetical protein
MESGLLFIAAVMFLVAAGFTFALLMSMFAIREADRSWPQGAASTMSSDDAAHNEMSSRVAMPEASAASTTR